MDRVKKIILSLFVVGSVAVYSFHAKNESSEVTTQVSTPNAPRTPQPAVMSATMTTAITSPYKNGSFTGIAADAYYGNVQVEVTISNGKINDVLFLQFPDNHHESNKINLEALPLLKQEAIQAQTAEIDGVTGATDTSQAFVESLQSALNQAKV